MNPSETPTKKKLEITGTISFEGDDIRYGVRCDRIAVTYNNELLFASFVGDSIKIKGIRGILNTNRKVKMQFGGMRAKLPESYQPRNGYRTRVVTSGYLVKYGDSYHMETHRIQYGQMHAVVWTDSENLILSMDDTTIWETLKSEMFTTPIMPQWTGYLKEKLIANGTLNHAYCQGCDIGTLTSTDKVLDKIVSRGLENNHIHIIPQESNA